MAFRNGSMYPKGEVRPDSGGLTEGEVCLVAV